MSTSIKELTPIEILFNRPAVAGGVLVIIAMVLIYPAYNTAAVLLGFVLYWILYQNRFYIYKIGLPRYEFLCFLFYISFMASFFLKINFEDISLLDVLKQGGLTSFLFNKPYRSALQSFFVENIEGILHLKLMVFAPAIAGLLYLIFVEFERKKVREIDLQGLGLSNIDTFRYGNIFTELCIGMFFTTSALFGFKCLIASFVIISAYMWLRRDVYAILAFTAAVIILVWNYAYFNYLMFLSIPGKLFTYILDLLMTDSYLQLLRIYWNWDITNYGQFYILVPYLLISGLSALKYSRNYSKVVQAREEKAANEELTITSDAINIGFEIAARKQVRITHKELNTHMYINGASGSGKTVAMLNFVIEAAEKKLPLIYIDGKGATDLEEKIATIAGKYGRKFKVFTLSPDSVPEASGYDFLGSGTFTEKKNRIMELFIQADAAGVSYYQDNLETFINRVFMVIHQNKLRIDLFRFLSLISSNDIVDLAKENIKLDDGSVVNWKSYFEEVRDMKPDQSPRMRIITKLDPFIHSSYGYLFNVIDKRNIINLKESIKNGEIVLFLFDASAFALDTERVAKMVISDINATFAEFGKGKNPIKTFCCFDEFKSYETDAISKTISLHRSNGMHAIIGTQSLSLINREIGNGILSNCQTHLIMASADADAQRFAEEFGTANQIETTTRIRADIQEVSDLSTKTVRDYRIDKQDIKDIRVHTGQGYLHRKAVGAKPVKIQVQQKI